MEALRDLADDFNVRGAEGRRGPAGAGAPAARAGQVGRRGAERPAAGLWFVVRTAASRGSSSAPAPRR